MPLKGKGTYTLSKTLLEEAMIVREQHTPLQEIGGAFRERLVITQNAFSLFARIRCYSLFIAGFAVYVAVTCCSLVDQVILAKSTRQRDLQSSFRSSLLA
jgi:hypothetical protein